jgi:hypothetical protein
MFIHLLSLKLSDLTLFKKTHKSEFVSYNAFSMAPVSSSGLV